MILWCGGEDIDFPNGDAIAVTITAGHFRAGYARCAISPAASAATMKSTPFPGGAVTSCWVSFEAYRPGVAFETQGIGVALAGAAKGILAAADATGFLKLWRYDSGAPSLTQLAIESSVTFTGDTLHRIDMEVAGWGAAATVNIYLDGVLRVTYTGDLTFGGAVTGVDSVWARSGNASMPVSEIVVADEDTRLMSLVTMAPNGAGTSTGWTGAYTDVAEVTIDDATALSDVSGVADAAFPLTGIPGSPALSTICLKTAVRAKLDPTAPVFGLRFGETLGNTFVSLGSTPPMTVDFGTFEWFDPQSPALDAAATNALLLTLQTTD